MTAQTTGEHGRFVCALALLTLCTWLPASGAAQPYRIPTGLSAPLKPLSMPAFELPTTAGGMVNSESLRGRVVIVRYWASW
jgi:hypothetical protein